MHDNLPRTMAAVQLVGHGGLDKLVYSQTVPVPTPAAGEVLIAITACGMNNTDVWVREGAYGTEEDAGAVSTWRRQEPTLTFPRIQGTDIVGNIVAAGEGVSPERMGQRVMVDFSIYNREDDSLADIDYIGHGRDGGYAEYVTVPAENAHLVDTKLSDVELATFCCAYLTGEQMLERAGLKAGERLLVTGASGGVGSGIVQLGKGTGGNSLCARRAGQGASLDRHRRRSRHHPRNAMILLLPSMQPLAASLSMWWPISLAVRFSTTCCGSCAPRAVTRRLARLPDRLCSLICGPCI